MENFTRIAIQAYANYDGLQFLVFIVTNDVCYFRLQLVLSWSDLILNLTSQKPKSFHKIRGQDKIHKNRKIFTKFGTKVDFTKTQKLLQNLKVSFCLQQAEEITHQKVVISGKSGGLYQREELTHQEVFISEVFISGKN